MRWYLTLLFLGILLIEPAQGGEPLIVQLLDGRTTSGELDSATDTSRLWIHRTEGGIALRSGFDWENVHVIEHGGRKASADEFRKVVGQLAASKPPLMEETFPTAVIINESAAVATDTTILPVAYVQPDPPPVRSMRLRAWAASWDDDPELDGVLVEVTPLGPSGELVPVAGQLDMTLIGENSPGDPEQLRRFRPRSPEISRGSRRVAMDDFWGGPAVYQLPYRNLIPEEHLDLFPQGVLTATLGVPGQGNFTASTDALSLIPASPIRDRRQQWTGRRYFPQERSRLREPFSSR